MIGWDGWDGWDEDEDEDQTAWTEGWKIDILSMGDSWEREDQHWEVMVDMKMGEGRKKLLHVSREHHVCLSVYLEMARAFVISTKVKDFVLIEPGSSLLEPFAHIVTCSYDELRSLTNAPLEKCACY